MVRSGTTVMPRSAHEWFAASDTVVECGDVVSLQLAVAGRSDCHATPVHAPPPERRHSTDDGAHLDPATRPRYGASSLSVCYQSA